MAEIKEIEKLIEEQVSKVLTKIIKNQPTELCVYDFDDTLVKTEGKIYVVDTETNERTELCPHDFHTYVLKGHEKFDLSDFEKNLKPTPLPHLKKMKKDYSRLGAHGVSICTARPYAGPVIKFISSQGMPDIEIVAVGEISPEDVLGKDHSISEINAGRKKKYIRNKILKGDLKKVTFYDDNIENCSAVRELANEFPEVELTVELVKS